MCVCVSAHRTNKQTFMISIDNSMELDLLFIMFDMYFFILFINFNGTVFDDDLYF